MWRGCGISRLPKVKGQIAAIQPHKDNKTSEDSEIESTTPAATTERRNNHVCIHMYIQTLYNMWQYLWQGTLQFHNICKWAYTNPFHRKKPCTQQSRVQFTWAHLQVYTWHCKSQNLQSYKTNTYAALLYNADGNGSFKQHDDYSVTQWQLQNKQCVTIMQISTQYSLLRNEDVLQYQC